MNDTAQTPADQFRLTVDYGQSLEEMIAAGHYSWVTPDIIAVRFPMQRTGTVQIEATLFHFGRYISSEAAVDAIKADDPEKPWEPANIEYLLSFGASHLDEQHRYPIVALGSVAEVRGDRRVPCLWRNGAKRELYFRWWTLGWRGGFRCLAVRPPSPES